MSGVVKAAKKVFKKVTNVAKRVAPVALAVGAVAFTAGAALGLPAMAGGWGGAISGLTSSLGLGQGLTSILTGALTQAGYGAALGAGISALGGGDPMQGALYGGLGGAATGGLMGAAGYGTDPLAGTLRNPAATDAPVQDLTGTMTSGQHTQLAQAPTVGGAPTQLGMGAGEAPTQAASGGLFGKGGWLERNQELAGGILKGVGQGLLGQATAEAEAKAAMKLARERHNMAAGNYDTSGASWVRSPGRPGDPGAQTPEQRWGSAFNFEYAYDRQQGRIVRRPRRDDQETAMA